MEKFTKNGKTYCYHYNFKYCNICFRFIVTTNIVKDPSRPWGDPVFIGAADNEHDAYVIALTYAKAHHTGTTIHDKNPYKWRRKYSSCRVSSSDNF